MRGIVVRLLVGSLIAALLLPVLVAVVLGLAALLHGLGDVAAAVACQRLALVAGVLWVVAIIVTTLCSGVIAVDAAASGTDARQSEEPPR
jgi:hypothetical protein